MRYIEREDYRNHLEYKTEKPSEPDCTFWKYFSRSLDSAYGFARDDVRSDYNAAGHAILEAIGGQMIDLTTKETLKYGKGPTRKNESFIALAPGLTLDQFLIP